MDEGKPITWKDIGLGAQRIAIRAVMDRRDVPYERAEDAVAEAAFRLIQRNTVAAFPQQLLIASALNLLTSFARRDGRGRQISDDALSHIASPEEEWDGCGGGGEVRKMEPAYGENGVSKRVANALSKLSESDRQALTDFYIQGRTPVAMDEEKGLPRGTSKARIHRARNRLRVVMGASTDPKRRGR